MDNMPVFWYMYKDGIVAVFVDVFCKPYQKKIHCHESWDSRVKTLRLLPISIGAYVGALNDWTINRCTLDAEDEQYHEQARTQQAERELGGRSHPFPTHSWAKSCSLSPETEFIAHLMFASKSDFPLTFAPPMQKGHTWFFFSEVLVRAWGAWEKIFDTASSSFTMEKQVGL